MDYTLDVRSGDEHYPELVPIYGIIFASKAERVFADVKRDGTAAPLHLGVVLDTSPMSNATEVWLGFSSLTLYVLPVRREIVYSIAVSTTWHGQPLKTYRYEDSANRWVGLFFCRSCPSTATRRTESST